MKIDKVSVDSKLILSLESGDTRRKKGGTQEFLAVEMYPTIRNGL
jgi:hypothetical protein